VDARVYTPGRNIAVSVEALLQRVGSSETVKTLATGTIFIKRPEGRLLMRQTVKAGEKVRIQLVGAANWGPVISLSANGASLASATSMTKVGTDGKVTTFEYTVPENIATVVPLGTAITAAVSEPLTGFLDQGAFTFTGTSLDDLAGQIAASGGGKTLAQDTLNAVKNIQGSMRDDNGHIGQNLEALKQKIDRIPRAIAEEGQTVQMRRTINQVADSIKTLAGDQGYDFSQLVKKGLDESPNLKQIRKKTDEVQGATEVMQILMERKLGGVDDPVVHVTYQ